MTATRRKFAVIVVEGDTALPEELYSLLGGLGIEVLGPVNNALDTLRLARDHHPKIAILDSSMEVNLLHDLHGILPTLGVHCLDVSTRDNGTVLPEGIGSVEDNPSPISKNQR